MTLTMKTSFLIPLLTLTTVFASDFDCSFISSNNLFTASVYREVLKLGNPNFLISPFSAQNVLAFVQSGAKGQTAEEIRTSLNLPKDQDKIVDTFRNLLPKLKVQNAPFSFTTANKLYLQKGFKIKNEFKLLATDVFYADLENLEFSRNVDAAESMNRWVENRTENKIHDFVQYDSLSSDTKAVIINALYFKGNWSVPFDGSTTSKGDFVGLNKKVLQVDTMRLFDDENVFDYAENKLGAKFLELPFQGDKVSMGFVLPNEKDGIVELEKQIDQIFLVQNFTKEYVNMSIPKFKIENKLDFKLILQNLGVVKAFSPLADFSGISDTDLYIDEVHQKTFIDVHEDGVEAAAATFAGLAWESAHYLPTPKQFHVDRPFIYYIKIQDLIVFAGRVAVPTY